MMTVRFDADSGLIIVHAEVTGPTGVAILRLAVDTGVTGTLINSSILVAAGYDLALAPERIEMTTGSGVEFAPRIPVTRIRALGHSCENLSILGHTLPPSAGVDGLLGLDFFRGCLLTIDFRTGAIEMDSGGSSPSDG